MIKRTALALLLLPGVAHAADVDPELAAQIAAADAAIFHAGFEGCDPDAMEPHLHPDFAMYHDLEGVSADSRDDFIASFRRMCADREPGGDQEGYMNRRELVPGSRILRPIGGWGALEEAAHVFYEKQSDGSWKLVGGARYMHLWQKTNDGVVLKQSYSYDHGGVD